MQGFLEWLKLMGGGQKILWALVMFVVATAILLLPEKLATMSTEQWIDLVKWLTAFVFGGNVATKAIHAFSKNPENGE